MFNFKKTTFSLFAMCITVLMLGSCKKLLVDKLTSKVNDAIGSMSCTVDGTKYTNFTATNVAFGGLLYAEGIAKLSTKPLTISVIISSKVDSGKVYNVDALKVELNWKDPNLSDKPYSTSNEGGSGKIQILRSNDKLIEGTFLGVLTSKDDKTKKVTIKDGKFLVKTLVK
jgi:hypothetical protein